MKLLTIVVVAICSGIASATSEAIQGAEAAELRIVPVEPNCDFACTMQYDPVCCLPVNECGEAKTFGNSCGLRIWNCQNPANQYYVYANHVACDSINEPNEFAIDDDDVTTA